MISAVDLTRELVRFQTINPPGNEAACARYLGALLEGAGFKTQYYSMGENRDNLIATLGGVEAKLPLCFSGHTDVVPLGAAPWSRDPFAADIVDGKIYGRGTTDMKGGIAAFVTAALQLAPKLAGTPGVVFVITAGEERGCEGALMLQDRRLLPKAGGVVIAEPTANQVFAGHKGVFYLEGKATGVTAHGSMPEKGINAVYKVARAALALEAMDFSAEQHPSLGKPTLNVGWVRGGINVNSVPDEARLGVDIRLVPGVTAEHMMKRVVNTVGDEVSFEITRTFDAVWTDPNDPWIQHVASLANAITGRDGKVAGAPYFTDAVALKPGMGNAPTIIMGPGDPELAHQTDESCRIDRIQEAEAIYTSMISYWCKL